MDRRERNSYAASVASALADGLPTRQKDAAVEGVEMSLIAAEPESNSGFVGVAVSDLVVQIGTLLSVFRLCVLRSPDTRF